MVCPSICIEWKDQPVYRAKEVAFNQSRSDGAKQKWNGDVTYFSKKITRWRFSRIDYEMDKQDDMFSQNRWQTLTGSMLGIVCIFYISGENLKSIEIEWIDPWLSWTWTLFYHQNDNFVDLEDDKPLALDLGRPICIMDENEPWFQIRPKWTAFWDQNVTLVDSS